MRPFYGVKCYPMKARFFIQIADCQTVRKARVQHTLKGAVLCIVYGFPDGQAWVHNTTIRSPRYSQRTPGSLPLERGILSRITKLGKKSAGGCVAYLHRRIEDEVNGEIRVLSTEVLSESGRVARCWAVSTGPKDINDAGAVSLSKSESSRRKVLHSTSSLDCPNLS